MESSDHPDKNRSTVEGDIPPISLPSDFSHSLGQSMAAKQRCLFLGRSHHGTEPWWTMRTSSAAPTWAPAPGRPRAAAGRKSLCSLWTW